MAAYYNENDAEKAAVIRELIKANVVAPGDVDERDIKSVQPEDLRGYRQCHFFAGIAGWSYALRLAGWRDRDPCWTGSCPCQPFSEAGRERGFADERDLWPNWFRIMAQSRPDVVFGEQVASHLGLLWADRAAVDFEELSYAFGSAVIPAVCVGAGHKRDRLFFVADAERPDAARRYTNRGRKQSPQTLARPWAYANWQGGSSGHLGVAHGIPADMAKSFAHGFGDAIVPQVAKAFIEAYLGV